MARQESDREDLLREATALVERIELASLSNEEAEPIVVGFRPGGAMSAYFGADPAYHFNAAGELRRAYVANLLYKAVDGRLVSLERVRTTSEVQLVSRKLATADQSALVDAMHHRLHELAAQLRGGSLRVVGQVPENTDVMQRVSDWLQQHPTVPVAASPHAR